MVPVSEGAVRTHCEVTIKGQPGDMLLGAFSDVTVRRAPRMTVPSADFDQTVLPA